MSLGNLGLPQGRVLSAGARAKLGVQIRSIWTKNPALRIKDIKAMTGAPDGLVCDIRARLVRAGLLRAGGQK